MSTQTQTQTEVRKPLNLNEIEVGDVFSEESHYVYLGQENGKRQFKHLESGQKVNLDDRYVAELLQTADQYTEEVEVGVEDKHWTQKQIDEAKKKGTLEADSTVREGDVKLKGIRSLWTDIHSTQVFSVCFNKKGKELTKKAFNAARDKQIQEALANISSGKVTLEDAFKGIQDNPINPVEKGEERVLRGYKVQFSSANGFYDVIDMDIEDDGKGSNLRKVNINEINWLVVAGVKYVVA
jgi:hypothetical protein